MFEHHDGVSSFFGNFLGYLIIFSKNNTTKYIGTNLWKNLQAGQKFDKNEEKSVLKTSCQKKTIFQILLLPKNPISSKYPICH